MSETNNEVAPIEEKSVGLTIEKIKKIEEISTKYLVDKLGVIGELQKTVLISQGIRSLRELITDEVMSPIMHMMGTPLGFVTDKDDKPVNERYTIAEVREVVIQGLLRGVFPHGNQLNIIATKLYIAKNGYTELIKKIKGLTDFKWNHELLNETIGNNQIVGFASSWKLNGVEGSLEGKIPIHVYKKGDYMDKVDGIMGKAERKLKYRIYCQITETEYSEEEEKDSSEVNQEPVKTTALEDRAAKIKADREAAGKKSGKAT